MSLRDRFREVAGVEATSVVGDLEDESVVEDAQVKRDLGGPCMLYDVCKQLSRN